MANGAIKGITIKLGADASELTTALYSADNALKSTQNELKSIDKALKFSPDSVQLLGQKFDVLQQQIQENDKYIQDLKQALNDLPSRGIEKNTQEYRALERELVEAESRQDSYKRSLQETENAMNHLGSSTQEYSGKLSAVKVAVGNLASSAIQSLISMLGNQMESAVSRVDTLENYTKTMQNLGYSADSSEKAVNRMKDSIMELPTATDQIVGMQQQYTALYDDIDKATDVTIALNDATLAGGQGTEAASRAMDAWYKIMAKGKPEQEQWQALNETMPAQMNQIAEAMLGAGAKSADLYTAWQDGIVTTDQVTQSLVQLDQEGGKGITSFAEQAQTATGGIGTTLENLKNYITVGLADILTSIGSANIQKAIKGVTDILFKLLSGIADVVGGLVGMAQGAEGAEEQFIEGIENMILTAIDVVFRIAPKIIAALATGIARAVPALIKSLPSIVKKMQRAIISNAPTMKAAGIALIKMVIAGVKAMIGGVRSAGLNIVRGIGNGIMSGLGWIRGVVSSFAARVKAQIKAAFGIASPSKWGRDIIGKNIDAGIADGVLNNAGMIKTAVGKVIPSPAVSISAAGTAGAASIINIGDVTLDASSLKDIATIEGFVNLLTQAKAFG